MKVLGIVVIMHRTTRNRRLGLAGLAVVLLAANHVAAQAPSPSPSPEIARPGAKWESDLDSGSMVLTPSTAGLVIGPRDKLSLQIDPYDIRVTGWSDSTFGALYFQREGGAVVVHASKPIDSRVYITGDGSVGVATGDPRLFAIDRGLIGPGWSEPPGALAVDGDIYAERVQSLTLDVVDRLRVGPPINPSVSGAARDNLHTDAKLQVGGKISAQMIVVHIDKWADDVFDADYELMPLDELEAYVQRERHLPGVPPQRDVERDGIDLAQTNEMLLRKVEELSLHAIDQQKKIEEQQKRTEELERRIDALAD
jgi:hypothetical protein